MTPLLFAAALSAVHPGQPPDRGGLLVPPAPQPIAPACADLLTHTVAPDGVPFWKLGDLPPPVLEHAIWRVVAGCPVREVLYAGKTYYLGSSLPTIDDRPATGRRMRRDAPEPRPVTPAAPQGKTP